MLYKIGKRFFLEIHEGDKEIEKIFSKKFTLFDGSAVPDIIISPRKKIMLQKEKLLGEVVIKKFCVTDGEKLAYIKRNKKLVIPFMDIGKDAPLNIECEVGFPPDWLRFIFDQIFAFHIMKDGYSLFHAAGVELNGNAVLLPGWRATGKTSTILALLTMINEKILYIGEDFVFVSQDGTAELYSDALHLDNNHMNQFKELINPFSLDMKVRLLLKNLLASVIVPKNDMLEYLNRGMVHVLCPGAKYFTKLSEILPNVRISDGPIHIKEIFLLIMRDDVNNISCQPIDIKDLITKMIGGMNYERKEFFELYNAFTFATGLRNEFIDNNQIIEKRIIEKAFRNSKSFELAIVKQKTKLEETINILTKNNKNYDTKN